MGIIKKFRIKSFKNINSVIEFENVSLAYGNRLILDNINFKINEGQIFGMLGPNGVGKSTIFNLITGLIDPGNGKIKIANKDVTNYPIYLRAKKFKLGYVPQYGGFFNDLSLHDNLKAISEIVIDNKNYRIAEKQMDVFGGMVSFIPEDNSFESAKKIAENLKLFTLAESLGGVESLCCHPASMTHASIPPEERKKSGLVESLLRLSVGIEDADDLIEDLSNAIG